MAGVVKCMGKKKPAIGTTPLKTPSGNKSPAKGKKRMGKKKPAIGATPLKTLILVLGFLAAIAMAGHIGIAITGGTHSAESLVGLCSTIIGYLGGLLTPRP